MNYSFISFFSANKLSGSEFPLENEGLIRKITHGFNNSLRFDPEDLCMAFTVRDPVVNGMYNNTVFVLNPSNAEATFGLRTRTQKSLKTI